MSFSSDNRSLKRPQRHTNPIPYGKNRPRQSWPPRQRPQFDLPIPLSGNRSVNLLANAYDINLSKLQNSKVFQYSIKISISEGFKSVSHQILFRNSVARNIRLVIMQKIIPQILGPHDTINYPRGSIVIDQNLETLYSLKPLYQHDQTSDTSLVGSDDCDKIIKFEKLPIEADLLYHLCIDCELKYLRPVLFSNAEQQFNFISSILHHQLWISMLRYGSVYYVPVDDTISRNERRLDLISQYTMGLSISGLRKIASDRTIISVNCPHSYITKSYRLIDLLASFIKERPIEGVILNHSEPDYNKIKRQTMREITNIRGNEEWFGSLSKILDGFKCRAVDPNGRTNVRFSLTKEPASSLIVEIDGCKELKSLTVQEYYKQIGIHLNYPNLPCLKSRTQYYPFELCSLLPNQKVPIFRLGNEAKTKFNLLNKPLPDTFQRLSHQARDKIESLGQDHLKAFNVSLSRTPVEAEGLMLNRPSLQFGNQRIEPQKDVWESGHFCQAIHLIENWCVVNTTQINLEQIDLFFEGLSIFSVKFGFQLRQPRHVSKSKQDILTNENGIDDLISLCQHLTGRNLRLILFVIDSTSTALNRLIHLSFDEHPSLTATCLRADSIMNTRQHRSIFRTLIHKLNARLGGTNVTYNHHTLAQLDLDCDNLMIVGLDVTHPDNELIGVSIVGCAYTYTNDLFRHKSLVWPQAARVEIIGKMDVLMNRLLQEYSTENNRRLPKHVVIYRDGVSHEEFDRVRAIEVDKAQRVIEECAMRTKQATPNLTYVIAQKRHTMRFFQQLSSNSGNYCNPPTGTLIFQDIVTNSGKEFYLYSNTGPQATARPLHYHVLVDGLGFRNLQNLTFYLCFNFGKCSGTLSMPSSLKYAHNAAYDARNRVIEAREFNDNKFYTSKFFC